MRKEIILRSGLVLFCGLVLVLAVCGCKNDKEFEEAGVVTLLMNVPSPGELNYKQRFILNGPVNNPDGLPDDPRLEGYKFRGWYPQSAYSAQVKSYDFTQPENRKEFTLYAWWLTSDGKVPEWQDVDEEENPDNGGGGGPGGGGGGNPGDGGGGDPGGGDDRVVIDGIDSQQKWNNAVTRIKNGGNGKSYRLNITGDFNVLASTSSTFGGLTGIEVEIQGTGRTIGLEGNGNLIRIGNNQNLVLNNISLQGRTDNTDTLVYSQGALTMKGSAAVSGNNGGNSGGGVYVGAGTFTMRDNATVFGNTGDNGGGVYASSTGEGFTMQDNATVSGNTASFNGGGVCALGTFTMRDNATVSGNTAKSNGGGVYASKTFTMQDNATVSGNTGIYGGGVYVLGATGGGIRMVGGTIYGKNASGNSNTGQSGMALNLNNSSAEYGVFNGTNWTSHGTLSTTDSTIKVVNGVLVP